MAYPCRAEGSRIVAKKNDTDVIYQGYGTAKASLPEAGSPASPQSAEKAKVMK
jgi:hypothetical protein